MNLTISLSRRKVDVKRVHMIVTEIFWLLRSRLRPFPRLLPFLSAGSIDVDRIPAVDPPIIRLFLRNLNNINQLDGPSPRRTKAF